MNNDKKNKYLLIICCCFTIFDITKRKIEYDVSFEEAIPFTAMKDIIIVAENANKFWTYSILLDQIISYL